MTKIDPVLVATNLIAGIVISCLLGWEWGILYFLIFSPTDWHMKG